MRRRIPIIVLWFSVTGIFSGCRFLSLSEATPSPAQLVERTVSVGGMERSYLMYVPEKARGSSASPVVLVFHGGGGRPENMPEVTGFNLQADEEGFVAVYPRGTARWKSIERYTWNGGLCCGWAQQTDVDDVGFIRVLLDDISRVIALDNRRIFAAGLSNGAIFSYRLACEMADRIAAIGPVSGTQNIAACEPSQPVSVIHFHGTADPYEPYEGGVGEGLSGFPFAPVKDTVLFWVQADGCTATAIREDAGSVIHEEYSSCHNGTAVELYTIEGGNHGWPGGKGYSPGGKDPSQAIDATDVMWEFFRTHPKPGAFRLRRPSVLKSRSHDSPAMMMPSNRPPTGLSSFEMFADLPAEEISALESSLEEKRLPAGKDVFREGEATRYCYFLLNGKVSVWYRRGNEEEQAKVLSPGEIFGEEAILGLERRHATAYVESEALVYRVSSAALRGLLRTLPKTSEILQTVARGRRLVRGVSFPWLSPDEAVFLATRKANVLLVPGLALPVLLGLLSLAAVPVIHNQGWPDGAYLLAAVGFLASLAYGAWSTLDWSNDYYLVTNRRVVAMRRIPLIYDDRQEAPLAMIQSVAVSRTVDQRAFGFGDVVVRTFTRPIVFQSVPNPNAVARLLETIWKRRQQIREQDDREEIGRLLADRLHMGAAGEESLEQTELPAVENSTAPAALTPAGSLGGMQTRSEQDGVVTYRKHRFFLFRNLFLPILLALMGIPLYAVIAAGILSVDRVLGIFLVIGAVIAGLAWAAYEYLDWANDLYQITSEQILALHRKPLGDEERRAAGLENILSLEYDRPSILARVMNFGTVKATVGQVSFTFDEVGDPVHVQEDIFRRMESKQKRMSDTQRRQRREEIADWIETYHNLTRKEPDGDEDGEQE